jgi:hypothetical protein
MKIYLAGGVTGNLNAFWKNMCKIHLSGTYSRPFVFEESMQLFLNQSQSIIKADQSPIFTEKPYILESYFYLKDQKDWILKLRPYFKGFLLDSGAFSFFGGGKGDSVDWKQYAIDYSNFINKYQVDNFIELDIERISNIQLVEYLRKLIQDKTGKNPISVWRPMRGIDYWYKMIQESDYVAISASGMYDSGWTRGGDSYKILRKMIQEAKKENCKVHGLGYTDLKHLDKVNFHSVDSTAWLYGNRGGYIYQFDGKTLNKIKPKGMRLIGRKAAVHNFSEWVKFSKHAENNF